MNTNPPDPPPFTRNQENPGTLMTSYRRAKNKHNHHSNTRETPTTPDNQEMVGSPGFEPGTTWAQATYLRPSSTTTPPQPEKRQPNLTLSKRLTRTYAWPAPARRSRASSPPPTRSTSPRPPCSRGPSSSPHPSSTPAPRDAPRPPG